MGFVYNNVSEAMARTFLEMNGWLVQTNLFTDLLTAPKGRELYKFEADVVAYKPPGTTILNQFGLAAPLDMGVDQPGQGREFFAGDNEPDNWAYCELKANFLDADHARQVENLVIHGRDDIEHKRERIARRFGIGPPKVVIMAYYFSEDALRAIRDNDGWYWKSLDAMFEFILTRFHDLWDSKGRVAYNDPWLDIVKHLAFHKYRREP